MAGRIRKDDVEALRERADIVAVVSDHTKLKRSGQRWKGLCPFHQERTPSFTVDPTNNLYYCFGCSEGGDIFDFLMKVEGLDFVEAVEQLARRTGVTLRYEEMTAGERRALGERSRLVAVMQAALEFFRAQLYADAGTVARDYLKERGFGRDDADRFLLGYAPNEWEALSRHLQTEHGFDQRALVDAGVAVRNQRGGLRDVFRGRLIFPVRDLNGDVIGFGGRVLPDLDYGDFDPPKYLNSRETRLYRKHKVLYGLHEARADVVRAEQVLVCEGYTDVMALHQAGFGNAVATCGTAVGADHMRILARYAERIVLAFDADAAGVKAAERAWEEARKVDEETPDDRRPFDLRVLVLPAGQDPADVVGSEGVEALRGAVEQARNVVPFVIEHTIEAGDLTTEEGKTAALRDALSVLQHERDPELRRVYARSEIAERIGVSVEFVQKTAARMGIPLDTHEGIAELTPRRGQDARGHAGGVDRARARARRERTVLRTALQQPELLPDEWAEVTADDFSHPRARLLFQTLGDAGGPGAALTAVLDASADDDVRRLVQEVAMEDPEVEPTDAAVAQDVRALLADRIDQQMGDLRAELARINYEVEPDRGRALATELAELEHRRRLLLRQDEEEDDGG